MEIQWKCDSCGQPLVMDSKYVGAKVECPKCKTTLTVPEPTGAEVEPAATAPTVACPGCGRVWPSGTVICTSCGTNISTGETISTVSGEAEPGPNRILSANVIGQAWTVVIGALGSVVGAFLVYMIVSIIASAVGRMIPVVGIFISILIGAPLWAGWSLFCLAKVRGQETTVGTLFSGFNVFGAAVGAYFLMGILIMFGSIFLIVPGIILGAAFSLTFFFIVDQGHGPWQAMKASYELTRGYRWRVLAISFLCSLINILGLLCLGIGMLVTAPILVVAQAKLYDRLVRDDITEYQRRTSVWEYVMGLSPAVLVIILAAMLLPALGMARGMGKRVECMSNLKQIVLSCKMYAMDYNEQFPPSLENLYPDYAPSLEVFVCPSTGDKVTSKEEINTQGSYLYVSGLSEASDSAAVLIYDREGNHGDDGRNVAFVDGHVDWVSEEEIDDLLKH